MGQAGYTEERRKRLEGEVRLLAIQDRQEMQRIVARLEQWKRELQAPFEIRPSDGEAH